MASYGYNQEDAEKVLEYQKVQNVKTAWGALIGGIAAYKF